MRVTRIDASANDHTNLFENEVMHAKLNDASMKARVFEIVRAELLRIRREQEPQFDVEIRMDSSLVADLGLDSLALVEAVVSLEQTLRIEHLSLEALRDRASSRGNERFTVECLVNLCLDQAGAPGAAAALAGK